MPRAKAFREDLVKQGKATVLAPPGHSNPHQTLTSMPTYKSSEPTSRPEFRFPARELRRRDPER
jgi:hypothetical protein